MQAGKLRQRVTIQAQKSPPDRSETGAVLVVFQDVATHWAKVEPIQAREFEYARTFGAAVSHKITMRYVQSLTVANRVVYNGRIFQINAVVDLEERHVTLVLYCTEAQAVVPGGA